MILKEVIILVVFLYQADVTLQWKAPSFISAWHFIEADNTSELAIMHGLDSVPAKVDVQVKIVENGVDYIFTGTSTAHRDNRYASDYGGVVFIYNSSHVIIYVPTGAANIQSFGGVAYTGKSDSYYDGPSDIEGLYKKGYARVRAWSAADFPDPVFEKIVTISDDNCFSEVGYQNGSIDFVIAQIDIGDGYFSEGQGNIFQEDTPSDEYSMGGVLFGYSNQLRIIRMWSPIDAGNTSTPCNGAVYVSHNGWGYSNKCVDFATVTLKGYIASYLIRKTIVPAAGQKADMDEIQFNKVYSLDSALVIVQVRQIDGNNSGMTFNGAGSAMITGQKYSGVVYVYTNTSALLYRPSRDEQGFMVYIGDRWGNGSHPSQETNADVIVSVYGTGAACPVLTNSDENYNYTLSNGLEPGSTVTYTCETNYKYESGNMSRTCTASGIWNGTEPKCTKVICKKLHANDVGITKNSKAEESYAGVIANYTCSDGYAYTSGSMIRLCTSNGTWNGSDLICTEVNCTDSSVNYTTHTLSNGSYPDSVAQYTCISGYEHVSGCFKRTCSKGNWKGVTPVCREKPCIDPGPVWNANYSYSELSVGSNVTYTCNNNTSHKAGNLIRTCEFGGYWSGLPPVCLEQTCYQPDEIAHGSVNYTNLTVGSDVIYTCVPGYSNFSGDLLRTCQSDGTWTGTPPVCTAITCDVPVDIPEASYSINSLGVGGQVNYTCDPGYGWLSGNLTRTCDITGQWDGEEPICTAVSGLNCSDPAVNLTNHTISSGLQPGSVVNYTCNTGYIYTSGYLTRTCRHDGSWDGSAPICSEKPCTDPGLVSNADYSYTDLSVGSLVTYTCNTNSVYKTGNFNRTCEFGGSWSGLPPVCLEITCVDPGSVYNSTYSITGLHPGDTANYTCNSTTQQQAGYIIRTCQEDGTWSGIPIVCGSATSCLANSPVTYSPETLAAQVEQTKKELTVEKKETSAYKRTLNCADDSRRSAKYLGLSGVAVLCSIGLAILIPDLLNLVRHICGRRRDR